MLSLFLVLAPPPQEEAKQRQGNPELVSPVRPGIRTGYTRIWRRRTERGGCAFRTPSLRVNYAARARLLLLAAIIFHLFNEGVRPRHATFRVLVPVEAVSPPWVRAIARLAQRSSLIVTPGWTRYSASSPHRLDTVARVSMEWCPCARRISSSS